MSYNHKERIEHALPKIFNAIMTGQLNTILPGRVTAFDGKNKISVQPVIKRKFKGKDATPMPILEDVPIMYFGAGSYWVTTPPAIDSWVLLLVSQRSIDAWKNSSGDVIDAKSPRTFNISDAVAVMGLLPFDSGFDVGDGLTLKNLDSDAIIHLVDNNINIATGDATIDIKDDIINIDNGSGSISIDGSGKIDLNGHLTVDA